MAGGADNANRSNATSPPSSKRNGEPLGGAPGSESSAIRPVAVSRIVDVAAESSRAEPPAPPVAAPISPVVPSPPGMEDDEVKTRVGMPAWPDLVESEPPPPPSNGDSALSSRSPVVALQPEVQTKVGIAQRSPFSAPTPKSDAPRAKMDSVDALQRRIPSVPVPKMNIEPSVIITEPPPPPRDPRSVAPPPSRRPKEFGDTQQKSPWTREKGPSSAARSDSGFPSRLSYTSADFSRARQKRLATVMGILAAVVVFAAIGLFLGRPSSEGTGAPTSTTAPAAVETTAPTNAPTPAPSPSPSPSATGASPGKGTSAPSPPAKVGEAMAPTTPAPTPAPKAKEPAPRAAPPPRPAAAKPPEPKAPTPPPAPKAPAPKPAATGGGSIVRDSPF